MEAKIKIHVAILREKHGDRIIIAPEKDFLEELREVYEERDKYGWYYNLDAVDLPSINHLRQLIEFFEDRSDYEYEGFEYFTKEFKIEMV